ncbi:MAG: quinoprotein dehydrogenase-associated putative ABC transporter substrate-binding protein [Mesorhizobium sp.]|nr:MAG: quinoprotein dehydrogenase-associated putative ABC transporter substrate-binding protein [Mesorhizobium sp.]TJU94561.1 MAG: quinoprotein dehydrogenase-associated putative ABC transporter substrate-binding protein [Mesorhizobium sp.]TJV03951.1 MAG: quinoprotein dehydrogenase-associated putative ABC transporter substrate-binding protein [Mesorhizobium sp.]TJV13905.1 MAG: quinoprotein dehydrogenase-associated putative ABC transporter substrate-binding protein [Mesorhizobium sp.]TJV40159.1 
MCSVCPDVFGLIHSVARNVFPRMARGITALVLLVLPATAGTRELRVCADPNNLPFSNAAGQGFENRIAEIIAGDLGAKLTYTWWAQRRGFIRNTLKAGRCDLVPGTPANLEMLRTTAPYYRSSYVFVTRQSGPDVTSFNDPRLRDLRIGVQLIGDDGANSPPVQALGRRGIVGHLVGYPVYGDYSAPNPPARIVEAVASGEIDLAVVWGPLAGYFAQKQRVPLRITPVTPRIDGPQLPLMYDISMGVRREDDALRGDVNSALARHKAEIDAVLAQYGVPRLDMPGSPVR